jgi:Tol biopolymer transport system component
MSEVRGISRDGRFVLFSCDGSAYLRDAERGETKLVDRMLDGKSSGVANMVGANAMSGDGRYIVFSSKSGKLVKGDTNKRSDVFLYDSSTGRIKRVSNSTKGKQLNGNSSEAVVSGNGRYVFYVTAATNMKGAAAESGLRLARYDIKKNKTKIISASKKYLNWRNGALDGLRENGISSVSYSGRYIVFSSPLKVIYYRYDEYLLKDYARYRYDMKKGRFTPIPHPKNRYHTTVKGLNGYRDTTISPSGRYATFMAASKEGGTNLFLHDFKTKKTIMANSAGEVGPARDSVGHLSPEGRYVVYVNQHPGNKNYDVRVYDRVQKKRVTVATYSYNPYNDKGEYWGYDPATAGSYAVASKNAKYIGFSFISGWYGEISYRIKTG